MWCFPPLQPWANIASHRFPSPHPVPLHQFALPDWLHLILETLLVDSFGFGGFLHLPGIRKPADDGSGTTNRIRFRFRFWLFLLGHCPHLVQIPLENRSIGNVFGRLG
jgi:hypothetical protein